MEFYWWFAAALVFFILEIVTPGFVLLWFGVGALAAGMLDLLGLHNVYVQTLAFVIVSIVFVSLSRTLFKNVFMRQSPGAGLRTNMDALVGKTGVVTETIDRELSTGRVLVEGQDWSARSDDGSAIETGAHIHVTRFEGARLIVSRG